MSAAERSQWIERHDAVPLAMQCELAGIARSTVHQQLDSHFILNNELMPSP